ncbi:MAG: hypothetical protein H7Z13_07390 [Ferruginibacter sp.]|nr:hypothetical protein [Ferruginibacter sp.]
MRNLILFGLLIILLLAVQFTSAKTVDEVIEKYLRARGGKDKLASVKSIYMEGAKEIMGRDMTVKVVKEQDKLSRTEIETSVGTDFVMITAKGAWVSSHPGYEVVEKIADEDLAIWQTALDISDPLSDYIAKGHKAELLGKDTVEGNNCYKIKLTTGAGREMMFWVDTITGLLSQSTGSPIGAGIWNEKGILTLYKNYKEVAGVLFAHTYETRSAGTNAQGIDGEIFFHTILVNPTIDHKMYSPA